MKRTQLIFSLLIITGTLFGQDPATLIKPIVEEGKLLYRSEMAAWQGTDLFLANYPHQDQIGGYFSYAEGDTTRCVFFSQDSFPTVLGTMSFDTTFQTETARMDLEERHLSVKENDLLTIRRKAQFEIRSDTMFKSCANTNLNLIPLISGEEKKVYILTGPQVSGVVIFGNDYLITFDGSNEVISKKALHRNIIPIHYGKERTNGEDVTTMLHSHSPETGELITPTDICTLMLYSKYVGWKTHQVVSKEYLNIWSCETSHLTVLPMDVDQNMSKQQKKGRDKKRKNHKK